MCWYNSGMTLNRLLIVIGMVVLLLTVGAVWLWQYAYSPEGRADYRRTTQARYHLVSRLAAQA